MYLKLTCKITIGGKYVLRGVENIEIKKSVHQIIQSAKVTLPLSIVLRNHDMLERIKIIDKIKEGDSIKLEFGYNGNNRVEFEGYIRRINYSSPVELECEDELYLFRKVKYKESFREVTLKKLIEFLLAGLQNTIGLKLELYDKMPQMNFKNFRINNANGIEVLQELKDKYLQNSYITTVNGKKTLYVGLGYSLEKDHVNYVIDRNVINATNLKYENTGTKSYRIKVTAVHRDGTKVTAEVGEKGGDTYEINMYADYDKEHLEQVANGELQKTQTAGYKGNFETFLIPFSEPGTIAVISNKQFPDRKGTHFVGTVTTTFGLGGGRRKPEIDIKLSI